MFNYFDQMKCTDKNNYLKQIEFSKIMVVVSNSSLLLLLGVLCVCLYPTIKNTNKGPYACFHSGMFQLQSVPQSEHVDMLKNHLDVFLSIIPDQLTVAGQSMFYQQTWY